MLRKILKILLLIYLQAKLRGHINRGTAKEARKFLLRKAKSSVKLGSINRRSVREGKPDPRERRKSNLVLKVSKSNEVFDLIAITGANVILGLEKRREGVGGLSG